MESIMVWIWLAVAVASLIIEFVTPELVSIWFGISAAVCIAFSFIPGLPWWGEIIIFACLAILLLVLLRPVVKRLLRKDKDVRTNLDRIIGSQLRMITQADFDHLGTAKVNDVVWNIKSRDGDVLEVDKVVRVVDIDGNKLIAVRVDDAVADSAE